MARKISYQQAINEALAQEMRRDPSVFIMGEDNAGGAGAPGEDDAWGGVLGVTKGLYHQFPGRVLDTPLSEIGYVGAAVGAATRGMRPVCELMFVDFAGCCLDQILNQAAKFRYMFGGKAVTPLVIRTMVAPACAPPPSIRRCSLRYGPTSPASRWSARRRPTTPRACWSRRSATTTR